MLSRQHRLRASNDFTNTVRNGRRIGARTLVVHFLAADIDPDASSRVGFIVSRAVGGSVTRKRVARRLRHVARSYVAQMPAGSLTVVRALPKSAGASSAELERDFAFALRKLGLAEVSTADSTAGGAA